ncbi:FAD-binding oxidoreductase [Streptomyces sp. NPDC002514]|uniref:FAD-binding oxidoreductase n=1 Tax=unclassified Streptomyces TaxID=2593676 RepID=UPI0036CC1B2F
MAAAGKASARELWQKLFEAGRVLKVDHDIHPGDIGGHRPREVVATVSVDSVEQVQDVVRAATQIGARLYPLSTGANWGMGSRFPVVEGCTVLDLSAMTRIRELDLDHGYAVIEPGVTQAQLAKALEGSEWVLNVTSSCADTSMVGNALERGDGIIRSRVQDTLAVEAVLGNGELLTTGGLDGHSQYHGRVAGPDLTAAFVESNLGVVTAMVVSLVRRPETTELVYASFRPEAFPDVADAVVRLGRAGLPTDGLLRLRGSVVPAGPHALPDTPDSGLLSMTVPLLGRKETVQLSRRLIQEALESVPDVVSFRSVDAATVEEDDALYFRARMALGIPTCASLRRGLGVPNCEVEDTELAWLMFLPLVPLDREHMVRAVDILRRAVDRHTTALTAEFNIVSPHIANMVVQIAFSRTPESTARAHALRDEIRAQFADEGFPAYRSNIDHMGTELALRRNALIAPLADLKQLFDPRGVISPGRYLKGSAK